MHRLVCLALAVSAIALASPAKAVELPEPTLAFEKYQLKNGLAVILSEDHRLPLVAVDVWYHVGAANEAPHKSGFAHLFEHMMFQGSKHLAGSNPVNGMLESVGATFNGTTDFDRTNYFETLPANQLETGLWLESDRMGFLLDTLDQKKLDLQRDVVKNEKREGDNLPYELADREAYHQLFPEPHPYYGSVLGSMEDLSAASLDDVRSFFHTYYAPNNATLVVAGDFDPARAKELIEKYFGPVPAAQPKPILTVNTVPIAAEKRTAMTEQVHLPKLVMAWHMAPIFAPGDAEGQLLSQILGTGKASRLHQKLVFEKQIAQDVQVSYQPLVLASVLEIGVVAREGHTLAEIEAAVQAELDLLRSTPVSEQELARARNGVVASVVRQLEELGGFGGKADQLALFDHYLGDPGYLPKDLARYKAVGATQLKDAANKYLGNSQRVVISVNPALGADQVPEVRP